MSQFVICICLVLCHAYSLSKDRACVSAHDWDPHPGAWGVRGTNEYGLAEGTAEQDESHMPCHSH